MVMTRMKRIAFSYRLSFLSTTAVFLFFWILCVTLQQPCHGNKDQHRRLPIPLWRNIVGNRQKPPPPPKSPRRHDLRRQQHSKQSSERRWRFWRRRSKNNKKNDTREESTRQDEPESSEEEEEEEEEVIQVPGNMLPHGIFRGVRDRMSRDSSVIGAQDDLNNALIPLVYRYYGRNRARTHTAGSIPFLLLGPNVDHWKVIGQQLAAKGFSVMTCEQVQEDNDEASVSSSLSPLQVQINRHSRVRRTLLTLLDALRWNRVVLVACDAESALAVEAALELAPDRVVGLVLCGNLDSIEPLIDMYNNNNKEGSVSPLRATGDTPNTFHVDRFLKRHLACPFTIVWGGDDSPVIDDDDDDNDASKIAISTPVSDFCGIDDELKAARRVILGAGSAPHRRRPEMFSWVLTRFVEEEIATLSPPFKRQSPSLQQRQVPTTSTSKDGQNEKYSPKDADTQSKSTITNTPVRRKGLHLPFELQEFFSSQAFVVVGRVVAATLFYGMALKVGFYQYENLGTNIRTWLRAPGKWSRKVVGLFHVRGIWSFLRDKGDMPVLSRLKRVTRRILFFLPFTKDESQTKQPQKTATEETKKPEDDEIEPIPDDSNVEKPKVPEPVPEPTTPPSEEDEKSNDDGTENGDDDDDEEEEEAKPPGFKPFYFLDRVIA